MTIWLLILVLSDGVMLSVEYSNRDDCIEDLRAIRPPFGVCTGVDYEDDERRLPLDPTPSQSDKSREAAKKFRL